MTKHGGQEEAVKIACQTVLRQALQPVYARSSCVCIDSVSRTCPVKIGSTVSLSRGVKETWVTVAIVLYLAYGSMCVFQVQA